MHRSALFALESKRPGSDGPEITCFALAAKRASPVCPRVLGIDEHSFTRRHGYATTFCDLKNHRVYDVVPGRSEASLETFPVPSNRQGVKIHNTDHVKAIRHNAGLRDCLSTT